MKDRQLNEWLVQVWETSDPEQRKYLEKQLSMALKTILGRALAKFPAPPALPSHRRHSAN